MFKLSIKDVRLWVHLGCSEQERFNPQRVGITIDMDFKDAPQAVTTDELKDTVCYAEVVESIEKMCGAKHFKLIEYMAAEICGEVCKVLGDRKQLVQSITVNVLKLEIPVSNVHGGVSFTYSHTPP